MIRARQLVGASIGISAVTAWGAFLGLITTPYLIHRLGVSRYGVFAVITVMSAYLSNLEFGFGQATIRFLARAKASGDIGDQRAVLQTGFTVFFVAGLVATAIALVGSSFVAHTFVHVPARLRPEALDAIRLGALILFVSFLASFASSSLMALVHFQAIVTTRAVFGTLASVTAVAAVSVGGQLRLVLIAQLAVTTSMCLVLIVALVRASCVPLRPHIHMATLRAMAGFGVLILISGLAYQAMLQGPPTILAGYSSTDQLAAFAVPNLIFQQLALLASATSLGFLPFVSASSANPDRTHLSHVYRANLRLTLLSMGPVAVYLACFSHPLLATWIGAAFASKAAVPLQFLGAAALALALSAPPADVARGLGHPRWIVAFTGCAASATIGTAFLLVPASGAGGAAFALLIGLTLATLPFIWIVASNLLRISLLRSVSRPLVAVAGLAALDVLGSRISSSFIWAVAVGVVGTCVYALATFQLVLEERERDAFRRIIRRQSTAEVDPRSIGHAESVRQGARPE